MQQKKKYTWKCIASKEPRPKPIVVYYSNNAHMRHYILYLHICKKVHLI